MKRLLLVLLLCIVNFVLTAQKELNISENILKYDTNYISSFSDRIAVKFYGIIKDNSVDLFDKKRDKRVLYSPNENFNLGLGINYKWIGIAAAFNFPFMNNDDHKYGKTDKLDLQINSYGRKIIIDANLQYYRGYYIQNPSSYNESWEETDSVPVRPDLTTISLGASCLYSFNNRQLSYRSSFVHNERQEKSAGSFLLGGYFSIYGMFTDSANGLVPKGYKDSFDISLDLINATSAHLGIAAGYIQNFSIRKRWYVTLSLLTGLGLHSFNGETPIIDTVNSESKIAARIQTRIACGYNGDKFFAGLSYVGDNYSINSSENFDLSYGFGNFRIFVGTRFNFRKKLKPDLSTAIY